ncbi:uncharacterized protein LOC118644888 isoform X2 [Monomorium pharaonis]|uniref:uncharacterized protein LOC118644888 isoform X2 n=1 Tax=Monomorium pharaonis TaxID=307658 RepID=UPI0017469426|nr:uncharacterized protein LOC118644888 isoform X2 [Monomorium pharaonis]
MFSATTLRDETGDFTHEKSDIKGITFEAHVIRKLLINRILYRFSGNILGFQPYESGQPACARGTYYYLYVYMDHIKNIDTFKKRIMSDDVFFTNAVLSRKIDYDERQDVIPIRRCLICVSYALDHMPSLARVRVKQIFDTGESVSCLLSHHNLSFLGNYRGEGLSHRFGCNITILYILVCRTRIWQKKCRFAPREKILIVKVHYLTGYEICHTDEMLRLNMVLWP